MVDEKRAIVFVNTKRQCDAVNNQLEGMGCRWAHLRQMHPLSGCFCGGATRP
jgi:superfamily II DNA/RNA helicase